MPFIETTKKAFITDDMVDPFTPNAAYNFKLLDNLMDAKAAQRSMQTVIQWILFIPVYLIWGYWSVLGCLIVWWFGFDDLLYYILLKIPAKLKDRYEWLESWTVHLLHRKPVDGKLFVGFSLVGILIGSYLGYLDKKKEVK